MFSYGYASWILMGLICWACFAQLWRSYREQEVRTLEYFAKFFAHLGLFFVIMGAPALFHGISFSPEQLGAFYIFGHLFLYSSFAYYSRIPMYIWKPDWEMKVFGLNLVAGAIVTAVNIVYWNLPEISSGVTLLNVQDPVGPMIGVLAILNWVVGGTYLFGKMALSRSGAERKKLIFLSLGLLMISIAGPIHDVSTSVPMILAADILTLLSVALLMLGIYFKRIFSSEI